MPTLEELKDMAFLMSAKSAAGTDGFGASFYQGYWSIIHDNLLQAIQEFFKGAQQLRGFSNAMLILFPKVSGASQWREFRPIILCNFSSKFISKILAIWLNSLPPKLISPWQSDLVPRRGIVDSILLAQESALDLDKRLGVRI